MNKVVVKDRFPLPLIDDLLDRLKNKHFFTKLDLKNAFHHVPINESSIKYTSFVVPQGQFEYIKMPFGYCHSPSIFKRYIREIFKELIEQGKILIYIDDILIATETIEENLEILREVFKIMVENLLFLRIDKCSFLNKEIKYLGYLVNVEGIRPSRESVQAIDDFPVPRSFKELRAFLGMVSYFRRYIKNFSVIAAPLYSLLKKDAIFSMGPDHINICENLKNYLSSQPVLAIYSPFTETQLHTDACSLGFGAVVIQRQTDGKFHPVFYFSKRASETESKYHSFELEMLAVVYALQRFRIYLQGLEFTIVTDCNSLKLALAKRDINPRILRCSLILQDYTYKIEHRGGDKMKHVDALSRSHVLILEENSFERNLSIVQDQDSTLKQIREKLEIREQKDFELRNGMVYRKKGNKLLFYVPEKMVDRVIFTNHDSVGHIGVENTIEMISRTYWFPKMWARVKSYISNCLKCIVYSPKSGKREGYLHSIPKGNVPFETIHIDHYGPLEKTRFKNKYIFEVVDGFTKFICLYPCKTTATEEVIKHLTSYFKIYSRPMRVVADRGSAFTSKTFGEFLESNNITLTLIGSGTPRANGQIERENRILTPMLSKLSESPNKWDQVLPDVECALNNTINNSTGEAPSKLLFGVYQKGKVLDCLKDYLVNELADVQQSNLENLREQAAENIVNSQRYNEQYYNKSHKPAISYKVGDLVMITNIDVTPGVNKKLIPKFRGPYKVTKVMNNDRYEVEDVEGFQVTQMPYNSVVEPNRMKPWISI